MGRIPPQPDCPGCQDWMYPLPPPPGVVAVPGKLYSRLPRPHPLSCERFGLTPAARRYLWRRRWLRALRRLWPWGAKERRQELPKGGPYR